MKDELDQFIDGIKQLPPSPTLIVELINLFKRPDRNIDQLIDLMSHDPSVTAEVLKRCNTAFFGSDTPATELFEATFRLGFFEVYRVVAALHAAQLIRVPGAEQGIDVDLVWEHSALTAVCASLLAKEVRETEGTAFLGGLLHDVGKVALACSAGVEYRRLAENEVSEQSLSKAEKEHFGFSHSEVGGRLLARWGLPANVFTPVMFHHSPIEAAPFERLAAILTLGDSIAYCLAKGTAAPLAKRPESEFSMQVLQLKPAQLSAIMTRARQDAKHVNELFHIKRT